MRVESRGRAYPTLWQACWGSCWIWLQCGNINLCKPLSANTELPGHMPWNVAVADRRGRVAGSGLLVHPNAVLTGR